MNKSRTAAAHQMILECAAKGKAARFLELDTQGGMLPSADDDIWIGKYIDGEWLADFLTDASSQLHRRGVTIVGARIIGGLPLDGAVLSGSLALLGCQLGGNEVNLVGARCKSITLTGASCGGLNADAAEVNGNLQLDSGFIAVGTVSLVGATIRGSLKCGGGTFHNPGNTALAFGQAHVTGDAILNDGFRANGEVRLPSTTIGGSLKCRRAAFTNPGDTALWVQQAHIARTVFLDDGFTAQGDVRLLLATIGGDLDCTAGHFSSPGRNALLVPSARIAGSVWLNSGFSATGSVILAGDSIGGDLDCSAGTFFNPGGSAIRAEGAKISGAVHLSDGFLASGEVRLHGASIGRKLDCSRGTFANPNGQALGAKGTQVAGEVFLDAGFSATGLVSFRRATAASLVDDKHSWPERIDLSGFRYAQLHSPDRSWLARREWLRRQSSPGPDAYTHLASVYRNSGDEHDARKTLIERHNALLRPPAHWTVGVSWPRRCWRWLLRYTIGHGYEPWRVLVLAIPVLIGMSLWYSVAARDDLLIPVADTTAQASHCEPSYTCVQPVVYALDTLVPLVELGQRSRWTPDQSRQGGWLHNGGWLAAATWITTGFGWAIATLVAASFSQVVRRE